VAKNVKLVQILFSNRKEKVVKMLVLIRGRPLLKGIVEQKETVAGADISARFNRLSLLNLLYIVGLAALFSKKGPTLAGK
jgi:hypothetical protein